MDLKTYNEITNLLNKKSEIEEIIKEINKNSCALDVEDYGYIVMDKQLITVITKEYTKRLNAINGALKELNFEV